MVATYQTCTACFLPAFEHGVKHFAAFVPDAEFGAHPIMLFGRFEDFDFRKIETLEKFFQIIGFVSQLLLISGHFRLLF